jgi:putative oxidoreductase
MNKYFTKAVFAALALPMIIFGFNKFLGFAQVPPPEGETAKMFLTAMFSSYLVKLVGITEIVGGTLLLFKRTSFLGYLVLSTIMVNIVWFHIEHDMPGNMIWLFSLVAYAIVSYLHKDNILSLIRGEK